MNTTGKKTDSCSSPWREREEHASKAWGILIFGFIGATITTLAVSQLRRSGEWFYSELSKSQSNSSWRSGARNSGWGSYREEAWRRYNRRQQQEYDEEMERVRRIRRMQNAFNREKAKYKRSYERWRVYGPGAYQHFQQDDWYWQTDTSYSYKDQWENSSTSTPRNGASSSMSHHYRVLGLDSSRMEPYSDAEIKTAFRAQAMKYHPDQNQNNKEAAEAKFKEVMTSYEAIKSERKNNSC